MNKIKKQLTNKMKHADKSDFLSSTMFWRYWHCFDDEKITNLIEEIFNAIKQRTM